MKRIFALLLCLCMLPALAACGARDAEVITLDTPAPADPAEPLPSEQPAASAAQAPDSVQNQLDLIAASQPLWFASGSTEPYYFAVTDLDGNGRLEIFSACTQGTGMFTSGQLFEVNESYNGLSECSFGLSEGDALPEVTLSQTDRYTDPVTGDSFYIFYDTARNGADFIFITTVSVCLKNGSAVIESITTCELTPGSMVLRDAASGKEINQIMYDAAADEKYASAVRSTANFGWFTGVSLDIPSQLKNSWKVFQGELPPSSAPNVKPEPHPLDEPEPTPAPVVPIGTNGSLKVTKNPTSESLAIGGKTWFIAHASNSSEPVWQLLDTNNRVYTVSEAMAANPGLVLEVLDKGTIAVDKVPAGLNGWSLQAVFTDGINSVATNPATIYVGDYVKAYDSVISSYRKAYAAGRVTLGYALEHGISEMAGYSDHVGYAMKDLNKDGTPELIIAATGSGNNAGDIIFEIDTLSGGKVVNLCMSSARNRFYLRTDSVVYNRGSSGAAYTTYRLLQLTTPKALATIQEVRSDLDSNARAVWYYTDAAGTQTISEAVANGRVDDWESIVYTPIITKIA